MNNDNNNNNYRSNIYKLRYIKLYTEDINKIVQYPIWDKQNSDKTKRTYHSYDYTNCPELREDVRGCVYVKLAEVLHRIKTDKRHCIDNIGRYTVTDRPLEECVRLIAAYLRLGTAMKITKMLKEYKKNIDDLNKYYTDQKGERMREDIYETFSDRGESMDDALRVMIIKDAVKDFLKDRDKLDYVIFSNYYAELVKDLNELDTDTRIVQKAESGKRKLAIEWTIPDIADICNTSERTVIRRKKQLDEDFRICIKNKIKPYL